MKFTDLLGDIIKGVGKALPFAALFSKYTRTPKDDALVQNVSDELGEIESFAMNAAVISRNTTMTGAEKAVAAAPLTAQTMKAYYASRGKKLIGGKEDELIALSGNLTGTVYDISKLFE